MDEKEKTLQYLKSRLRIMGMYTIIFFIIVLLLSLFMNIERMLYFYIVILCLLVFALNMPRKSKQGESLQTWDHEKVRWGWLINLIWSIYLLLPPFLYLIVSGA